MSTELNSIWSQQTTRCNLSYFFNSTKKLWQVDKCDLESGTVIESWTVSELEIQIFSYSDTSSKSRPCMSTFGVLFIHKDGQKAKISNY